MNGFARPSALRKAPGRFPLFALLAPLCLAGCEITGVEYLPPEPLRSAPHAAASPARPAAPAPAPSGTAPVELQAACGSCHGLDALERSSARGAGWEAFLEAHRAGGFISPDERERAALLERLRSVYP